MVCVVCCLSNWEFVRMIQDILTYVLITIAFLHAGYGIYKTFFLSAKKKICGGCSDSCQIKQKKLSVLRNMTQKQGS